MAITQAPQQWIKYVLLIGLVAAVTACGGGGGGKKTPPTPPDTTPNAFTFTAVPNAEPGAEVTSDTIPISGINSSTPVSIVGGQYAIGSGAYTSVAGNVTNGQTITIKVTASDSLEADATATLNVGGVVGSFIVTTLADTTAPTAQITFPPPVSMKDGESILVRGTASDDYSAITSLVVNGVEAESDDGFANWTALVALLEGDNTITVTATDSVGIPNENAASVTVRRAASNTAFPDKEVPISYATGIAVDIANNRALVANFVSGDGDSVIAVDLSTGIRTVLSGPGVPDNANAFLRPAGIVVDPVTSRNQAIMADEGGSIFRIDLTDGTRNILSSSIVPNDQQVAISNPVGIALDPANENVAYVVDDTLKNLQQINLVTGERTLVSDNDMPESGPEFGEPERLLIDSTNNRAIVADLVRLQLMAVDLATGVRSIFYTQGVPETQADVICPVDLATDNIQNRIFIADCLEGINILDLTTNTLSNIFEPVSPPGLNYGFMHMNAGDVYALYVERSTQTLFAVDPHSKDFVILSKSVEE